MVKLNFRSRFFRNLYAHKEAVYSLPFALRCGQAIYLENNNNPKTEDFLNDLPVQSEEIGFKPDEMLACKKCARVNPPNRVKCMYCGAELEISAAQAGNIKPNLRKLELWEQGFNVIYLPNDEQLAGEKIRQIAQALSGEKEFFQKLFDARKPLPLVRCETAKEAEILQNRLNESGVKTSIISDENLAAETQPTRLRGVEFRDKYVLLTIFNTGKIEIINLEDLKIIVSGAIFQKAVEATEARKKGTTKILDASETASDESLIDIYTGKDANGYRILTKGFDFSCLGAEKGILARDNIKKLAAKLRTLAPQAKFVDDYLAVRGTLGEVWEVEQRRDSQGLSRQRFGKFDLSSVSSSNNLQQFNKYSRLQWHLL
jgi:hypothetical protein